MIARQTPTQTFTGMAGTSACRTCPTPPYMPPTCSSVSVTVSAQAQTSQLDAGARARHAVEPFEAGLAGEDRVASELRLHDRLDRAAHEHDPQRRVADLRAERRRGDELARSDDRRGEDDARADAPERLERRSRRCLDRAAVLAHKDRPASCWRIVDQFGASSGLNSAGASRQSPATRRRQGN